MYDHDKSFIYESFKHKQDKDYPLILLAKIQDDQVPQFQKIKIQYLLEIWVRNYRSMGDVQKHRYVDKFKQILSEFYSAYVITLKLRQAITLLYYLVHSQWTDFTSYLRVGVDNSQRNQLQFIGQLTYRLMEINEPLLTQKFAAHLSYNFQESLRNYNWKSHRQKIVILQIIKHINFRNQYSQFLKNGYKWVKKINRMISQDFKSEINPTYNLHINKLEYQLMKKQQGSKVKSQQMISQYDSDQMIDEEQIADELTKTRANQIEINPFRTVKNVEQQKCLYDLQIKRQIIECRHLLCAIDINYWKKTVEQFIKDINENIIKLNKYSKIDSLKLKILEYILNNSDYCEDIIQGQFLQNFIIKILEALRYKESIFHQKDGISIMQTLNNLYFQNKQNNQRINQHIDNIIKKGEKGEDDLISRSILQSYAKYQRKININQLQKIESFINNSNFQASIDIYVVLCKILLQGLKFLYGQIDFKIFKLCKSFERISSKNLQKINKRNQLNKLSIKVLHKLLQICYIQIQDQQVINQAIINWIAVIQTNSKKYENSHMKLIYFILKEKYPSAKFLNWQTFQNILHDQSIKLSQSPYKKYTLGYLNPLLEAGYKFRFSKSSDFLKKLKLNPICFRGKRSVLMKQSELLLLQYNKTAQIQKKFNNRSSKQYKKRLIKLRENKQKQQNQKLMKQELQAAKEAFKFYIKQQTIVNFVNIKHAQKCSQNGLMDFQFVYAQYLIYRYLLFVQQFYTMMNLPDDNYQKWLLTIDSDLLIYFQKLYCASKFKKMYQFAIRIYHGCRNYYLLSSLKSYKFLKQRCFSILSIHYNKCEVLTASACFSCILLPYRNSNQLSQIYQNLNQQQFLLDLFKGCNQLIAQQLNYGIEVVIVMLAYDLVLPLIKTERLMKSGLTYLNRNLEWWFENRQIINPEFPKIQDELQEKQNFSYIIPLFRECLQQMLQNYYVNIIKKDIEEKYQQKLI